MQEYSSDSGSEPDVQLENEYYAAKVKKQDGDVAGALEGFHKVLSMETAKGDWGFKALKQMVKVTFGQVSLARYRLSLAFGFSLHSCV